MKEQFVSYEIALKLKELGFDEECIAYFTPMKSWMLQDTIKGNPSPWLKYRVGDNMYLKTVSDPFGDNLRRNNEFVKNSKFTKAIRNISTPLWQQVQKWLREVHNIHIVIIPFAEDSTDEFSTTKYHFSVNSKHFYGFVMEEGVGYDTYEQCLEQGIIEALKLIK